jgi:hypothetical protein
MSKILDLKESLKRVPLGTQVGFRNLLIGIAVVLLGIVVIKIAWNMYGQYNRELQNEIELKQMQYDRLVRILEKKDEYTKMNKALHGYKREFVKKRFVQGETQTLAEAKFQNIVNGLAQETEVNILSMRMLPSQNHDGLRSIRLGINCRAEIGAVTNFVVRIYEDPRFIFFDQLEVKIVHRRENRFYNFNAELSAWTEI